MANLATISGNILGDSGIDSIDLIVGTGTVNYIPKFTAEGNIGNSLLVDNGSTLSYNGSVVLNSSNAPYAANMNQYVRTTDAPTFAELNIDGSETRRIRMLMPSSYNGSGYNNLISRINFTWYSDFWDIGVKRSGGVAVSSMEFWLNGSSKMFELTTTAGLAYLGGNTIVHSGNYSSYAVPISGGVNMTGSFGLNDTKLYLRTNGDNNHYLWNAGDDWEELNAYEGTGFRITSNQGATTILYVYGSSNGGYTYSPYSFRAPIFYDSQDTGYYLDPNSTSVLNWVGSHRLYNNTLGSNYYFGAGSWGFRHQTPSGYIEFGPANTSYAHIYTDRAQFYFNAGIWVNGGSQVNTSDIRASIFYDADNTGYYADFNSTSTALRLAGNTFSDGAFGVNGAGASSTFNVSRIFAPRGAAYSGNPVTGAIKIRLPIRGNDTMWSMKVRIYNYSNHQTSEYTLGNYSYADGAYHYSAAFMGASGAIARTVRFGNEGGYDCVWIGETSTSWSYPVVSVVDYTAGYSNSTASTHMSNWDISVVSAFGNVVVATAPDVRFSSVIANAFYDSDDTGYYLDLNSTSNSSLRIRGGALFGPNPTWGAYLQVGGDGRAYSYASVVATSGNLHLDAANGYSTYINYYSPGTIYLGNNGYTITSNGSYYNGTAASANSAGSVSGLTITNSSNGVNPDNVTQNQIGYNTSVSLFGQTDGGLYSSAYNSSWIHQIYGDFRTGQVAVRGKNSGTWQAWRVILDSGNYSSYALPLSGGTISGNLGVGVAPDIRLSVNGDAHVSQYLYMGGTAGSAGSWGVRVLGSGGTYTVNANAFLFNNVGYGSSWNVEITTTGTVRAYGYQGNANIGGTGNASWHPSGIYCGGTMWQYGDMYKNYTAIYDVANIYNHGWFRNNNANEGLYNQTTTMHWSSKDNGFWDVSSTNTVSSIRLFTGGHVSSIRGYLYANTSNEIGFLRYDGNWTMRTDGSSNCFAHGTLYSYNDVVAYYSDDRLKTRTGAIENALSMILSLDGFVYKHNELAMSFGYKGDENQIGLSAQQVQAIAPELVTLAAFDVATDEAGNKYSKSGQNYLTVKYDRLVPVLVEALKEQQKQIEELKSRLK